MSSRDGMLERRVQRVEVEPGGLDLGALGDLVPHGDEHVAEQFLHGRQGMARAGRTTVGRQRDVDGFLDEDPGVAFGLELGSGAPRAPPLISARAAPTR